MKFTIPCINPLLQKEKLIDGASVWINNIAHALREEGHEINLCNLTDDYSGDYVIIQSEWVNIPNLQTYKNKGGKVICLLGHFIDHVYPAIEKVKEMADLMITAWKGELLEGFDAHYLPHAFGTNLLTEEREHKGDIVWAGNTYALRDEGPMSGVEMYRITGTQPIDVSKIYRGAKICPNIHGAFQMNEVSDEPSKIADKPGMMINERTFHISGCGGFQLCQEHPLLGDFFDEIATFKDNADFKKKVAYFMKRPQEREALAKKNQDHVLKHHTYNHRVKELLTLI